MDGDQDGHLDFHTALVLLSWCFTSTESVKLIQDEEKGWGVGVGSTVLVSKHGV